MPESSSSCTCGRCFEGWLSPRMRERLEYSTELRYGLAKSLLDTQDGVPKDVTQTISIDYAQIDVAFYYLPHEIRAKIKSPASAHDSNSEASGDAIYRGYITVFKVIKELASSPSDADDDKPRGFPTVLDVEKRLSELRASDSSDSSVLSTKARGELAAFLDNGGSAEHALDCIVDRAREELSPLGTGYDEEKQYIDEVLDAGAPECANDLDFALVRVKLGLPLETRGVDVPNDERDGRDPESDEGEE